MIAIASIPLADVQGQIITLTGPSPSIMNLNISFANNTNATLTNEHITEEQGNLIVSAVNTVLANLAEDLEDLELEEELEEIEEDEEDNGGEPFIPGPESPTEEDENEELELEQIIRQPAICIALAGVDCKPVPIEAIKGANE